jgi:hypothetical protein
MEIVILVLTLLSAVSMQEEFYLDTNGTSFIPYQPPSLGVELNIPIYQYDEVLHHYRSDIRKREPQFLGFDIQDDNIEIDMEIAVPFLTVPTKKSMKRKHFANINVAAMILAGNKLHFTSSSTSTLYQFLISAVVALGGTLLGGTARFLRGENFFNGRPLFRNKKNSKQKRDIHQVIKSGHEDFMWTILNNIDESLLEIDFDIYNCAQRFVCWQVKNSLLNVHERQANNVDRFVVGVIK